MNNNLSKSRVLLINVGDPRPQRIYREYPLGLGYIGTILSSHSASVVIYDLCLEKLSLQEIIKDFQPTIIGLSFLSTSWPFTKGFVMKLRKQFNGWIITGGIHSSLFPHEVLQSGVDVVLIGEGETNVVNLVECLQDDKLESLASVPDVAYMQDNKMIINKNNTAVFDLNTVPFINRDLYHDLNLYSHHSILTSRGCPYSCKFCCNWGVGVKKCRSRSPINVVEELKYLKEKYGANTVYFADDLFFFNESQRIEFCDLVLANGLDIEWVAQLRADNLSEKLLRVMKKSGCVKLCFGIESGSQEILNSIGKRIKLEQIRNTFKLLNDIGIKSKTWWILGLPGNYEQQLESLKLMKELKPNEISIHTLIPLPGSEYWDRSDKYGIHIQDRKDLSSLYYHSLPTNISFSYLTAHDIRKLFIQFITELKDTGYKTTDECTETDDYILSTPFEEKGFKI